MRRVVRKNNRAQKETLERENPGPSHLWRPPRCSRHPRRRRSRWRGRRGTLGSRCAAAASRRAGPARGTTAATAPSRRGARACRCSAPRRRGVPRSRSRRARLAFVRREPRSAARTTASAPAPRPRSPVELPSASFERNQSFSTGRNWREAISARGRGGRGGVRQDVDLHAGNELQEALGASEGRGRSFDHVCRCYERLLWRSPRQRCGLWWVGLG